jgi:hypothetical protein
MLDYWWRGDIPALHYSALSVSDCTTLSVGAAAPSVACVGREGHWRAVYTCHRSGRAAARGARRRGPLLAAVQARPRPSRRGRRRAGRTTDPLAQRADRVLRDPPARRGMDLPIPRRRTPVGDHRTRSAATHLTNQDRRHRTRSQPQRPNRAPPRSAPGPAKSACRYPREVDTFVHIPKRGAA